MTQCSQSVDNQDGCLPGCRRKLTPVCMALQLRRQPYSMTWNVYWKKCALSSNAITMKEKWKKILVFKFLTCIFLSVSENYNPHLPPLWRMSGTFVSILSMLSSMSLLKCMWLASSLRPTFPVTTHITITSKLYHNHCDDSHQQQGSNHSNQRTPEQCNLQGCRFFSCKRGWMNMRTRYH
jgi:hypothetical protein